LLQKRLVISLKWSDGCKKLNQSVFECLPPSPEKVKKMTWSRSIFQEETKELEGLPRYKNYRILAIILLLITALVVGWFW